MYTQLEVFNLIAAYMLSAIVTKNRHFEISVFIDGKKISPQSTKILI